MKVPWKTKNTLLLILNRISSPICIIRIITVEEASSTALMILQITTQKYVATYNTISQSEN